MPSHSKQTTSFGLPSIAELSTYPHCPPIWADIFGEDDQGIFAEIDQKKLDFEFRWIEPKDIEIDGRQTTVKGFWIAELPLLSDNDAWSLLLASEFIETAKKAFNCPFRFPTLAELHSAKDTLRAVEKERDLLVPEGKVEFCVSSDSGSLSVVPSKLDAPADPVTDRYHRVPNSVLRLAIEAD